MPLRADLHVHTTVSDGLLSPAEALRLAAERGVEAVAITDHDTDAAHRLLREAGGPFPVALIAGAEVDTRLNGLAFEVLVYGHRPGEGPLAEMLAGVAERRRRRAEIIWTSLRRGLGTELPALSVLYPAPRAVVTRPQMAACLLDSGLAPHMEGALAMVTAYDVGFEPPDAAELIRAARASGGLCALAHPLDVRAEDLGALLGALAERGLAGVEVDYPYREAGARERVGEVRALARELGLFAAGGSDAHAAEEVGRCTVALPGELAPFARRS